MNWPPKWLEKLRVTRVALVGQGANPDADVVIYKAKDVPPPSDGDADDTVEGKKQKSMPARGDVHTPGTMKKPKLSTYKTGEPMPDPTEIEKQAADLAERVAKAEAAHKELTVRLEKAEKDREAATAQIQKLESDRRAEQYIAKARTFKGLPGIDDAFGAILEKAEANLSAEEIVKFEAVLSGAKESIRKGALFAELGRIGANADTAKDQTTAAVAKAGGVNKSGKMASPEEVEKALRAAEGKYNEEWANAPSITDSAQVGAAYLEKLGRN